MVVCNKACAVLDGKSVLREKYGENYAVGTTVIGTAREMLLGISN